MNFRIKRNVMSQSDNIEMNHRRTFTHIYWCRILGHITLCRRHFCVEHAYNKSTAIFSILLAIRLSLLFDGLFVRKRPSLFFWRSWPASNAASPVWTNSELDRSHLFTLNIIYRHRIELPKNWNFSLLSNAANDLHEKNIASAISILFVKIKHIKIVVNFFSYLQASKNSNYGYFESAVIKNSSKLHIKKR